MSRGKCVVLHILMLRCSVITQGESHCHVVLTFQLPQYWNILTALPQGQVNPYTLRKCHRPTFSPSLDRHKWQLQWFLLSFTQITMVFSIKYDDNWEACNYPPLLTLKRHLHRTPSTLFHQIHYQLHRLLLQVWNKNLSNPSNPARREQKTAPGRYL